MEITVEISYYPLQTDYNELVEEFIEELGESNNVKIMAGTMSSLVSGSYEDVMHLFQQKMKKYLAKYPSVFNMKISNACVSCITPA